MSAASLIGNITTSPAYHLVATIRLLRAELASETDETIKTSLQLMIDEIKEELGRRNLAAFAARAARGAAS